MTHTLHRLGTPGNLVDDYVAVILPAKGINEADADPKLRQILHIALRHNPNNIGSDSKDQGGWYTHTTEEIIEGCHGEAHAVFTNAQDVVEFLKDLKTAELGMSVVTSGVTETVNEICKEAGLVRHTVEFSLGIRGKIEKLPPREVLEITTMCGHHMISPNLVKSLVEDIKQGTKSLADAAEELARPCYCGCFNPTRTEKLLIKMARLDKKDKPKEA